MTWSVYKTDHLGIILELSNSHKYFLRNRDWYYRYVRDYVIADLKMYGLPIELVEHSIIW